MVKILSFAPNENQRIKETMRDLLEMIDRP